MITKVIVLASIGWPGSVYSVQKPARPNQVEKSPTWNKSHAVVGRFGGQSSASASASSKTKAKMQSPLLRRRPSFGLKMNPMFGFRPDDVSVTFWQWP